MGDEGRVENWVRRDLFNAYSNLLDKPERILLAVIQSCGASMSPEVVVERFELLIRIMERRALELSREVVGQGEEHEGQDS
jgi:hypothetical protein